MTSSEQSELPLILPPLGLTLIGYVDVLIGVLFTFSMLGVSGSWESNAMIWRGLIGLALINLGIAMWGIDYLCHLAHQRRLAMTNHDNLHA